MPEFSERLKELRASKNAVRKDIADHLEITVRAYQHYETGTRFPDFKGINRLADYFDVSTDYLLGRSDNPQRY